nr:hypothetical protein [uncultured Albidiferax sp.]
MEENNPDTEIAPADEWTPAPPAVIVTVTGYQWGDDLSFIGTYQITSIEGQAVHVPPRTSLHAPALPAPAGEEFWFNVVADAWQLREEDISWMDEATREKFLAALAPAEESP